MPHDWDFYFCRVNDALSSIFLDLDLADVAPDAARPQLLVVWLAMQAPRPDGMSSQEEADTLGQLEDALTGALRDTFDAVHAGRITGSGRREFYFYAPAADDLDERLEATMTATLRAFPGYTARSGTRHDPGWAQYHDVLYPNRRQLAQIRNRRVVEALAEAGDVLALPRPITHWVYFEDGAVRATTASTLVGLGFSVELEDVLDASEPRRYPLRVERVDRAEKEAVDAAVWQILDAIATADAVYDGWESPVTTEPG